MGTQRPPRFATCAMSAFCDVDTPAAVGLNCGTLSAIIGVYDSFFPGNE